MWSTVDEAWTQGLSGTFMKSMVTHDCWSPLALWVHPPPDSTLLWPEETLQQVRGEEEGRALPLLAPVP